MRNITDDVWLLHYPLSILGARWDRNVTVLRLEGGALLIHSTGPFTPGEVAEIDGLGRPAWVVECASMHDGFTVEGSRCFPGAALYVPELMQPQLKIPSHGLGAPPPEWAGELEVLRVEGTVGFQEYAFLHKPSRTLIVGDFVFNFGPDTPRWTRFMACCAVGRQHHPGMSRAVRLLIRDKAAFKRSADTILGWGFDRVIPGHRDVIETGGKQLVAEALWRAGY